MRHAKKQCPIAEISQVWASRSIRCTWCVHNSAPGSLDIHKFSFLKWGVIPGVSQVLFSIKCFILFVSIIDPLACPAWTLSIIPAILVPCSRSTSLLATHNVSGEKINRSETYSVCIYSFLHKIFHKKKGGFDLPCNTNKSTQQTCPWSITFDALWLHLFHDASYSSVVNHLCLVSSPRIAQPLEA